MHSISGIDLIIDQDQDKYWIRYLEYEQRLGATDRIETLFGACLMNVPSVRLWTFYMGYIRHAHSVPQIPQDKIEQGRATIASAYEFALQNVGVDKESGQLWADYIEFVKSGEVFPCLSFSSL